MDADQYMKHWENNKVWTHLQWPKHQRRFKICASFLEGENFIDIGCAYGHSTSWLRIYKGGIWAGLDFSKKAIDRANQLFKNENLKFYYSENYDLLPVCGQFDGVVCSEVIEHVEKDQEFVNGLIAITKKVLVITTPDREVNDPGHLRVYDKGMLEALFCGQRFKIHRIKPFFYVVVRMD